MPWCPKCKSEYRDGFSICTDCGSALVDEGTFARLEAEQLAAERMANVYAGREAESGLIECESCGFDIESESFGGLDAEEAENDAEGSQGAGIEGPHDSEARAEGTAVTLSLRRTNSTGYSGSLYRDNAERAGDNRSSAWVLLAAGGLGIVVLVLGITGLIPLHFSNAYLFYGVMAAVFILFLVAGIISMKNALIFEKSAESENSVRNTLLEWCRQNLKAEELDRQIGMGEETSSEGKNAERTESKEILYFLRFEAIKARLNHQFLNLDQGFLEKLIDDSVYDIVYGAEEEI